MLHQAFCAAMHRAGERVMWPVYCCVHMSSAVSCACVCDVLFVQGLQVVD